MKYVWLCVFSAISFSPYNSVSTLVPGVCGGDIGYTGYVNNKDMEIALCANDKCIVVSETRWWARDHSTNNNVDELVVSMRVCMCTMDGVGLYGSTPGKHKMNLSNKSNGNLNNNQLFHLTVTSAHLRTHLFDDVNFQIHSNHHRRIGNGNDDTLFISRWIERRTVFQFFRLKSLWPVDIVCACRRERPFRI